MAQPAATSAQLLEHFQGLEAPDQSIGWSNATTCSGVERFAEAVQRLSP